MAKKLKIGYVIEILTEKGLCYAHYTHENVKYGSLLRVCNGFYGERPSNLSDLVSAEPIFICFFYLSHYIKNTGFTIVGNMVMTEDSKNFPIFRAGMPDPSTRKVGDWWFWDGDKEWMVGKISEEQRKFPIREILNDKMLLWRIESGWTSLSDSR